MITSHSMRPFDCCDERDLDNGPFGMLKGINPERFAYLQRVLEDERGDELPGTRLLDVGCGIGLLAEPLAGLGCRVTAVDPCLPPLALARQRSDRAGIEIDYRQAHGESLPFADGLFEVVVCCDVLEHVDNLEQVLSEISRILKQGGIFIYGTLNRTPESWLLAIKALQDWPFSRLLPANLHRWELFIKPHELLSLMTARGLQNRELIGLRPTASPWRILADLRACKRHEISACDFGQRLAMRPGRGTRVQYFGYANKI